MNEIIKAIEEASVVIPPNVGVYSYDSGIPYWYTKGVMAGRQQAIDIILETKKEAAP